MKKVFLIAIASLTACIFAKAQNDLDDQNTLNPLVSGVPSLMIAPDARAGGMGDVGAATLPSVAAQHWNPSKYVFMESQAGLQFSYTPWLSRLVDDINLFYLVGYWKPDDLQAFSASLRYFSLGDVMLTDPFGGEIFPARPNEFAVDVAYSRKLSEVFSASALFRFIYSDLTNGTKYSPNLDPMYPGVAFAADISAYYRQPIQALADEAYFSVGINLSNLGSKISHTKGETSIFIPANLRLGVSFDYPLDSYNRISISGDVNKIMVPTRRKKDGELLTEAEYSDMSSLKGIFTSFSDSPLGGKGELQEIMWSVGLEYSYNKQFFIRTGYFNEHQNVGNRKYFTAGAGFNLNFIHIDAGYVIATQPTNPLDQTLKLSLGFDWDGIRELLR
ncbi:MAG: type IX secretion system outer membrane channel protein PorV [Prevotellaceae bacterium]|jgi:hypothetical protein|nr:type IX secretion system outer membrane channel protein PorV [Prevotellaceae bacterium]